MLPQRDQQVLQGILSFRLHNWGGGVPLDRNVPIREFSSVRSRVIRYRCRPFRFLSVRHQPRYVRFGSDRRHQSASSVAGSGRGRRRRIGRSPDRHDRNTIIDRVISIDLFNLFRFAQFTRRNTTTARITIRFNRFSDSLLARKLELKYVYVPFYCGFTHKSINRIDLL